MLDMMLECRLGHMSVIYYDIRARDDAVSNKFDQRRIYFLINSDSHFKIDTYKGSLMYFRLDMESE